MFDLLRSAKLYLYDSADYWRGRGLIGASASPQEAMASGCVVFSSLNNVLADGIDPGRLGHQIGAGTICADLERMTAAVADPWAFQADPQRLADGTCLFRGDPAATLA